MILYYGPLIKVCFIVCLIIYLFSAKQPVLRSLPTTFVLHVTFYVLAGIRRVRRQTAELTVVNISWGGEDM